MAGPTIFGILISLLGGWLFSTGFKRHKHVKLIEETPRSKIRSMAMGLVEVHGNAEADTYLKTPFSQTECVYYRYVIKEYRQRTTGTGKNRRTSRSWDIIAQGEQRAPFKAKDETGTVNVLPEGAEFSVEPKKVFLQKAGLFGAFNTIVGALQNWDKGDLSMVDVMKWNLTPLDPKRRVTFMNSVGDRKFYEYFITSQDSLFILGTCSHDQESKPVLKKGDNEKTFIISDKSEKELLKKLKLNMWLMWLGGIVLILGGVALLLSHYSVI